MIELDEIHTVTATVDGQTVASFDARLNDDDTVDGMRSRLVDALGQDAGMESAFDAAFERCEAIPGNAAVGCTRCGDVVIEIKRTIGE